MTTSGEKEMMIAASYWAIDAPGLTALDAEQVVQLLSRLGYDCSIVDPREGKLLIFDRPTAQFTAEALSLKLQADGQDPASDGFLDELQTWLSLTESDWAATEWPGFSRG